MSRPPKKPFGKPFRPRSESSDRPDRPARPGARPGAKPFGKPGGQPGGKPRFGKSEEPPAPKYHAKEGAGDAPSGYGVYKREGGPPRGDRPRTFDKPFEKRPYDPDRKPPFKKRPYAAASAEGERPAFKRPYDPDRKPPFKKRPYTPREGGAEGGERPAYAKRPYTPRAEGAEGGERPAYAKRPYTPRAEGAEGGERPAYAKRPYTPRTEGAEGGERPAYAKRPYSPRGDKPAFKKPFTKRTWTDEKPAPRPDRDFPESRHTANPENDLIHGHHAVAAAVANEKRKIVHLWTTENALARLIEENVTLPSSIETVHPRLLDHMLAGQDAVHQGIIVEAEPLDQPQLNQIEKGGLVVILDQVTDPHNVGAILRSCAAFGVTAVVSPARHTAAANGTLFKAASGAYEYVPFVKVTNLARAIEELKGYGFTIVGLDSEAETTMDAVERTRPMALVLGAEGKGVRDLTRESCDIVARLEMTGPIKSLNVSIATAVSLYALTR
jgi:23S rRNA (guanosine2251-2'-O)-methyltransferase